MDAILNHVDGTIFRKRMPSLKKANNEVLKHTIEIYLLDLDPTEETKNTFLAAVDQLNGSDSNAVTGEIQLRTYRQPNIGEQKFSIMMCRRILTTDKTGDALKRSNLDALWFHNKGFTVCRQRISCLNCRIESNEALKYPNRYHELTMKIVHGNTKDDKISPITKDCISNMKMVRDHLARNHSCTFVVEYGNEDEVDSYYGIMRLVGKESRYCKEVKDSSETCVRNNTSLKVQELKTSYVWFDSFRMMDVGWLELAEDELKSRHGGQRGKEVYEKIGELY